MAGDVIDAAIAGIRFWVSMAGEAAGRMCGVGLVDGWVLGGLLGGEVAFGAVVVKKDKYLPPLYCCLASC